MANRKSNKQTSVKLTGSPYKTFLETKLKEKRCKNEAAQMKKRKGKSTVKAKPKKQKKSVQETSSSEDEEWPCLVCCEPFQNSKGGEVWIQCIGCQKWAHEVCTPGDKYYECHNCLSDSD